MYYEWKKHAEGEKKSSANTGLHKFYKLFLLTANMSGFHMLTCNEKQPVGDKAGSVSPN